MKKVLVTGASGLVGSRFIELYKDKYQFITPEFPSFDMTKKEQASQLLDKEKPDVLVNFAAYTNVGEAENQRGNKNGDCWKINVEGVRNLLEATGPKTHFIHISTDMVFPGSKVDPGPYSEDHVPESDSRKVTWYGFTKAEGEKEVVKKLGPKTTILRLIYPVRAKYDLKPDYLRKPLSLFDEGKLYPMFTDQQVSVAFIDEIAQAIDKIIEKNAYGIFHASSSNTGTPFELASYLIEKVRGKNDAVVPTILTEFLKKVDNPVRYPMFGGLKVEKTEKRLGIKFRTWCEVIDELIRQGLN
jgi:dTDP-4-dehydrorhamnose reductase